MTSPVFDAFGGSVSEAPDSARAEHGATSVPGVRERWRMSVDARALTAVMVVLLSLGLVVLYSASALSAADLDVPAHYFLLRQAQGALGGLLLFAVIAKIDAERWRAWAWPVMIVSMLAMLVTILPFTEAIAPTVKGSRRFLFGRSLQPAEFAKLAVILWTPMLLLKKGSAMRRLGKGLAPFLVVIGLLSLIAMAQPDVSMAMTFCLLMAVILFAGGTRIAHFVFLGLLAIPIVAQRLADKDYFLQRLLSFLAGFGTSTPDATGLAYQQVQSLIAVGSGQLVGVGFGEGNQQRGWTPLAHNDFIASVVGEEFGFIGVTVLVLLFAAYAWLGFRIARTARTPYQSLVAIGLTYITVITAFVHVGVTINLLPNTGLTLPFISFGRSNLVLTMITTGMLVNIGSVRERRFGAGATDPFAVSGT